MANIKTINRQILLKLLLASILMFGFGYALVPLYKALCEVTGINVVTNKNNYGVRAHGATKPENTQVDYSRTVTIEFDSNSRGPFSFLGSNRKKFTFRAKIHGTTFDKTRTKERTGKI